MKTQNSKDNLKIENDILYIHPGIRLNHRDILSLLKEILIV